jgi:hypothetical protein
MSNRQNSQDRHELSPLKFVLIHPLFQDILIKVLVCLNLVVLSDLSIVVHSPIP